MASTSSGSKGETFQPTSFPKSSTNGPPELPELTGAWCRMAEGSEMPSSSPMAAVCGWETRPSVKVRLAVPGPWSPLASSAVPG